MGYDTMRTFYFITRPKIVQGVAENPKIIKTARKSNASNDQEMYRMLTNLTS